MGVFIDISGQRFGRLLAVSYSPATAHWSCLCDCGKKCLVTSINLRHGLTSSCGCLRREATRARGLKNKKHGGFGTKEYQVWNGMLTRCFNKKDGGYPRYGGRGITVCKRWRLFPNFLSDMGKCPPGMSIERKNNNGHYKPGNCIWASATVQSRNKRNTNYVYLDGNLVPLAKAAEDLGLTQSQVWYLTEKI